MLFLFFIAPSNVVADSDPYAICSIGGFFRGTDNKFMSGITTHIISRKQIFDDPTCITLHNKSFQLGRKVVAGENTNNQDELKVINDANDFREKVFKSISTQIGY